MTNLISGKEAKLAWADNKEVEYMPLNKWNLLGGSTPLSIFDRDDVKFRLKPRTITINRIEVPAPFKPKEGERVWFICDDNDFGYAKSESYGDDIKSFYGWWRSEDEIKQVVAALRQVFGLSDDAVNSLGEVS